MKKDGLLNKLDLLFVPTSFVREVDSSTKRIIETPGAVEVIDKAFPPPLFPNIIKMNYVVATLGEAVRIAGYTTLAIYLLKG